MKPAPPAKVPGGPISSLWVVTTKAQQDSIKHARFSADSLKKAEKSAKKSQKAQEQAARKAAADSAKAGKH